MQCRRRPFSLRAVTRARLCSLFATGRSAAARWALLELSVVIGARCRVRATGSIVVIDIAAVWMGPPAIGPAAVAAIATCWHLCGRSDGVCGATTRRGRRRCGSLWRTRRAAAGRVGFRGHSRAHERPGAGGGRALMIIGGGARPHILCFEQVCFDVYPVVPKLVQATKRACGMRASRVADAQRRCRPYATGETASSLASVVQLMSTGVGTKARRWNEGGLA